MTRAAASGTRTGTVDITKVILIAREAGERIMAVYAGAEDGVELKRDDSPLTLADKLAHQHITESLREAYPGIPVLSEEGKNIPYEQRKDWRSFWLVDPLDGTKEFIKRNGEFTVNIALICDGLPVMGVIYGPAAGALYFAARGQGAYKVDDMSDVAVPRDIDLALRRSRKLPFPRAERPVTVIASKSHPSDETEEYIGRLREGFGQIDVINKGSSLKLCMIAEGVADVYPRFAPTMEWDVAAGHAIVEEAGGAFERTDGKGPFRYNKEDLLNPWFIATRGD